MAKIQKLIAALLSHPKDLTWEELKKILSHFGYDEFKGGKTSGSATKFVDADKNIVTMHKPHQNKPLKDYQVKEIVDHLKARGKL